MRARTFKEERQRKNNITLGVYNSLFEENKHRSKALVSITIGDECVKCLFDLRRDMMQKLASICRRKKYKNNEKIAYFSNIEFGRNKGDLLNSNTRRGYLFNPHIHFQLFYDDFAPIEETLQYLDKKYNLNNCHTAISEDIDAYYGYIVKDYIKENYDEDYERNKKALGRGRQLYIPSKKRKIESKTKSQFNPKSNYAIRYLYSYLKKHLYDKWRLFKGKERYKYIVEQMIEKNIIVREIEDELSSKYIKVKNSAIYVNIDNM